MAPKTDSRTVAGPSLTTIRSTEEVRSLQFSSDRQYLVQLLETGVVTFNEVFRQDRKFEWRDPEFRPDRLAVGQHDVFAVAQGAEVRYGSPRRGPLTRATMGAPVVFLQFSAESAQLAIGDATGRVVVHDVAKGGEVRQLAPTRSEKPMRVLAGPGFSAMYLLADGEVQIVDCARDQTRTLKLPRPPDGALTVSDDRRLVAFQNLEGKLEVRAMAAAQTASESLELPWEPQFFRLSADGSVLVLAHETEGLLLFDTARREPLETHESQVQLTAECRVETGAACYLLAWLGESRTVRIWSPVQDVVEWPKEGPVLVPGARSLCRTTADVVRFRLASTPYKAGAKLLAEEDYDGALELFAQADKIMANYPGLALARSQADERREARRMRARLTEVEGKGEYRRALTLLEEFLREHSKFGDYGFKARIATLRQMIRHLDGADEHRAAGREVDAIIEFERAVQVVPELEQRHPTYVAMRAELLARLASEAEAAFGAKEYEKVVASTTGLQRLRKLAGPALIRLAVAHEMLGDATRAESVYLQVGKTSKSYVQARCSIAKMARAASDYTKSRLHLELAREALPASRAATDAAALEQEYAEVCKLCKDDDAAVAAWRRVGELKPEDPHPFDRIAQIEAERERWVASATALGVAIARSKARRPRLLVRLAEVQRQAGQKTRSLAIYQQLLDYHKEQPQLVAFLGEAPEVTLQNLIRGLDYVRRQDEWVPRDQFLEEQGWEKHDGKWLRPREARLREVAARYRKVRPEELRAFSAARYQSYAQEQRITKGMNRREVIRAWGFFDELILHKVGEGQDLVFEQLVFPESRRVYLRNGLVCYWSE